MIAYDCIYVYMYHHRLWLNTIIICDSTCLYMIWCTYIFFISIQLYIDRIRGSFFVLMKQKSRRLTFDVETPRWKARCTHSLSSVSEHHQLLSCIDFCETPGRKSALVTVWRLVEQKPPWVHMENNPGALYVNIKGILATPPPQSYPPSNKALLRVINHWFSLIRLY